MPRHLLAAAARLLRRPLALGALALVAAVPAAAVASASSAPRARTSPRLPTVAGGFGTKPKLSFPKAAPPKGLRVEVLHEGHGPKVEKGQLVVVNYYGQKWRGKEFDTSFGRGLFATPIGVNKVIKGWDHGLVGRRVGSRLLLSVPPKQAYGLHPTSGRPAGTLEFVIDLVGAYGRHAHGDRHATVLHRKVGPVTVGGRPGREPRLAIRKGASDPHAVKVTLIARGHGPKVHPGLLIDQFVARTWSGGSSQASWKTRPDSETVSHASGAGTNLFDKTIGMPLGSRVLFELPKTSAGGPFAVVVDLVAEPKG